jgi:hypothetical protein
MADGGIFHVKVSTVSRSSGRSSVAAAAYRAALKLIDERTGLIHDYRKKQGVQQTFIAAPDGCDWITDSNALWNAVEAAETRKNSTVAREWLLALPDALDALQRAELTRAYAEELVMRYGIAVEVAIHAPSTKGDQRNHHAHLLTTTRKVGPDGLGEKTRILDAAKTGGEEIAIMRGVWAGMVNDALKAAGSEARVDHRRKSVIAVELQAEAKTLEEQAKNVAALNGKPSEVGGVLKGLGVAARAFQASGFAAFFSTNEQVLKLRAQAQTLRTKAHDLTSKPLNRHHGPKMTQFFRAMEETWGKAAAAEAKAAEAARVQEEREQQRIEYNKQQNAKAAAAVEFQNEYTKVTLPLIEYARKNPEIAEAIKGWGIDLSKPDNEVARHENWLKTAQGHEPSNVGGVIYAAVEEAQRDDYRRQQQAEKDNRQAAQEAARKAWSAPDPSPSKTPTPAKKPDTSFKP